MYFVREIVTFFDKTAPFSLQESYDNSGLQIGNSNQPISGILISLDCTEATIDEAIEKKCNLIVCHHPLIFKGIKSITGKNYIEKAIVKAIKNDISILAVHTNLDNVIHGVNEIICRKLNLINTKILRPKEAILFKIVTFVPAENAPQVMNALFEAGCGEIGNYREASFTTKGTGTFTPNEKANPHIGNKGIRESVNEVKVEVLVEKYKLKNAINSLIQSHPYEEVAYDLFPLENVHQYIGSGMIGDLANPIETHEFIQQIKKEFQVPVVKHSKIHRDSVQKVAVCGGSGLFLLNDAITQQADIFITADVKYHDFFEPDGKIILADIGHFESEQYTCHLFQELLNENFKELKVEITNNPTNPVYYS